MLLETPLAFIDGIGGPELVLILVISLLLFGGKGMPNMARTVGKTLREFKKATSGIENEIKKAMSDDNDEPTPQPRKPRYTRSESLPETTVATAEIKDSPVDNPQTAPAEEAKPISKPATPAADA